eukprot:2794475-Rhodomonas_salina.1
MPPGACFYQKAVFCAVLLILSAGVDAQCITYSGSFVRGESSNQGHCDDWTAFRAQLTGDFSSMTMRGSLDPTGVTLSDPVLATAIASAMHTNTPFTGSSNGLSFRVNNGCSADSALDEIAVELIAKAGGTISGCACTSADQRVVRPCIANSNWGSIQSDVGRTCDGPSQTMMVEFCSGAPQSDPNICSNLDRDLCSSFADCDKVNGDATCTCWSGFTDVHGDGSVCEDIDECKIEEKTMLCDYQADCDNTNGSFACICPTGFVGDGTECFGDAWAVRAVFDIPEVSARRALTADQIEQLKLEYARLVTSDGD